MSAGHSENSARPIIPVINVTPLIDVLLVLLIIFMVVTPLKPGRFKVQIPAPLDKNLPEIQTPDTLLRVDVSDDLRLTLNGQEVGFVNDTRLLASTLADVFEQRAAAGYTKSGTDQIEKTVFIKAPRSVKYGEVVKVIDGIKSAGATPVGLQVDRLN
jgi:biopolymer transport protein ExbD